MSLSMDKLNLKQALDPRLDFSDSYRDYVVQMGAQQQQIVNFRAPSASNSSQSITINIPSMQSVVDREIFIEVPMTFTFQQTAVAPATPLNSYFDALRANPLSSIIQTMNLTIGQSANTTVPLSDVVQPISKVNVWPLRNQQASLVPCAQDTHAAQVVGGVVQYVGAQSANSPFALYSDNSYKLQRGASLMNVTNNVNGGVCTVQCVLREAVKLSPLSWSGHDDHGLVGISQMLLNITFMPNLAFAWSHADNGQVTAWQVLSTTLGQMNCYVKFLTPKTLTSIPRSVFYNYYTVNRQLTTYQQVIPANTVATFVSQNMILTAIPDTILVCARPARSLVTAASGAGSGPAYVPDAYLGACNANYFGNPNGQGILNVTWNAQSNVFAEFSCGDIFTMCKKNGYVGEFPEWSGVVGLQGPNFGTNPYAGSGSVIVIKSTNLPLNDGDAAGKLQNTNLNISFNAYNNTGSDIPANSYELCCIFIYAGAMEISNGEVYTSFAPLTTKDILDAEKAPRVPMRHLEMQFGGSWLSSIASGLKKGFAYVAPHVKSWLANHDHPLAKVAHSGLSALGYGKGRRSRSRGRGMTGGKAGKKSALYHRMRGGNMPSDSESDSEEYSSEE